MDFHTPPHDHSGSASVGHPIISLCLISAAWIFHALEAMTADELYKWGFRALSVVSLAPVIYVNWNKAISLFKSKNKKGKK